MSQLIEPVARLIDAFARLPGVGPKTAQRLTYHLLRAPDSEARALAAALVGVRDDVVYCERCFDFATGPLCPVCSDPTRDDSRLCVVEEPLDVLAIERTRAFRGRYHVLHGLLAPLDGVGPDDLPLDALVRRVREGAIKEVVAATPLSVEGEATALYLAEVLRPLSVKVSRIASGIPHGGELEYTDQVTVGRAFEGRREL